MQPESKHFGIFNRMKNSAEVKQHFPKLYLFKTSYKKLVLFSSPMPCAQALRGFCGSCMCIVWLGLFSDIITQ